MSKKSVDLLFSPSLVEKPILSDLIRNNDISVTILQASITPNEEGAMFIQMEGNDANIAKAIKYLKGLGVGLSLTHKKLIRDEERCTNCGACVGQCLPKALSVDEKTREIAYDEDKCIACGLCIPACPYSALKGGEK